MSPAGTIMASRVVAIAAAAIAALGLSVAGAQKALVITTAILAALICVHLLLDRGWMRLPAMVSDPSPPEQATEGGGDTKGGAAAGEGGAPATAARREWGTAFKDGANLVITVEGVVLGLVFAFIGNHGTTGLVNVGAASLAAGVVLGILLYSLASGGVPSGWGSAIASLMLNLSLYALAYGLICIVAALIMRAPAS